MNATMDLSVFLARIFAVLYLIVGIGILLNAEYYRKAYSDMIRDTGIMYLGGAIALVIGYLMVAYHNFWVKDWSVIITIIGWLALIKGLLMFILPKTMINLTTFVFKEKYVPVVSAVALILGVVLGYYVFFL